MKKKFVANWHGEEIPLTIESNGDTTLKVRCRGREAMLDVVRLAPNRYSVLRDDKVFDLIFSHHGDEVTACVGGQVVSFEMLDEKLQRRADHAGSHGHAGGRVVSPMPGKVVKVLVKAGDRVAKDQALVVVEAMKMENEFKAHADGVVTTVRVKAGDTVEANQILVEM